MNRPVNQSLSYVSQHTIAALNSMVADGKFLVHLEMLEQLENTIMTDDTGEPRPGVFQTLRTLRMLKEDIRTLNALCPDNGESINETDKL